LSNDSTYNGNPNLKPIGFEIQYTVEQVKEILKCSGDPIYFIENYCYIVSLDKGLIPFKLYDCQKEKVDIILNNRKVILMEGRQQGKTITAAACILWYTLFQSNKNVAILANKSSAAREVLHRYQIMYESLPIWMQQGVKTWNKGDVELENGSQVFTAATSASAIRGKSCVAGNTKVCIENNNSYYYVEIDKIKNNSNFLNSNKDAIMKYTVYKTTNNENNKEYIGFHSLKDTESILCECTVTGSIFSDGYLGSGKLIKDALHKYGPEKFRQELLGVFDKKEDAEEYEKKLVNNDYNIVTGGKATILAGEKNMKILSTEGFVNFESILDQGEQKTLKIEFSDNSEIICTHDHLFLTDYNEWVRADALELLDSLSGKLIVDISNHEITRVYDFYNVGTVHNYITNGVISHNCNWLYIDEAAIIPNTVAEEFFTSVYPTISSGETTKILLTSTPLGYNHFWKFWNEAEQKLNGFVPHFIHYSKIPGRDERWAEEQKAMLGELKFNQEVLCAFLGSSNTLISPDAISKMSAKQYVYNKDNLDILEHPVGAKRDEQGKVIQKPHVYMLIADTSRGVEGDYSAFTVVDITEYPYKIVAKYRDNKINPLLYPTVIAKVAKDYNNAYCLIEINDNGQQIANTLYHDLEYENVLSVNYTGKNGQFLSAGFKPGTMLGVRTTKQVKRLGCALFKGLVENQKLLIHDADVISEISTFIESRGSFAADLGYHDDLVMTLVLFAWATNESYFKDLTNQDLRIALYEQQIKNIEEEMTPFGVIDLGIDFDPNHEVLGDELWFKGDLQKEMEKLKHLWTDNV